jgi:hypothetical protein
LDGIYRAMRRGESSHMRQRVESAAKMLDDHRAPVDVGAAVLAQTRSEVLRGWAGAGELLERQGASALAMRVRSFLDALPPPRTDRELIAEQLKRQLVLQRALALGRDRSR